MRFLSCFENRLIFVPNRSKIIHGPINGKLIFLITYKNTYVWDTCKFLNILFYLMMDSKSQVSVSECSKIPLATLHFAQTAIKKYPFVMRQQWHTNRRNTFRNSINHCLRLQPVRYYHYYDCWTILVRRQLVTGANKQHHFNFATGTYVPMIITSSIC